MISLTFAFWMYVVLFAIIGAMRGWARELLVVFSVILSLALTQLLERFVFVRLNLDATDTPLFWIRAILLVVLVFFGYQTVHLPQLTGKINREKLQDSLLGFVFGAINGYLVVGTIWFYMHQAGYPFAPLISPPLEGTPMGDAATSLLTVMPPRLLGDPGIYFAVILSFIFVLVVFI